MLPIRSRSGAAGQLLSLRSTTPASQFFVDISGTRQLDYLDIQDSNSLNAYAMLAIGANFNDSGNNTNWAFTTAATCGNSLIEYAETCDDGNTASSDGCSSVCVLESGGGSGNSCTPVQNSIQSVSASLVERNNAFFIAVGWVNGAGNTLGNSTLEVYRAYDNTSTFDKFKRMSYGISANATGYMSGQIADPEFGRFHWYAVRFVNDCDAGPVYYADPVWVQYKNLDGSKMLLEVTVNLKINSARDSELLKRMNDLFQNHTNPIGKLTRLTLSDVADRIKQKPLMGAFQRDAHLRQRIRAIIDELFYADPGFAQNSLKVEFYRKNLEKLTQMATRDLIDRGYYQSDKEKINWDQVDTQVRNFLTTQVRNILVEYDQAKAAQTYLTEQLKTIATQQGINLRNFSTLSAIKNNQAIKDLFTASDAGKLISGHQDSFTIQFWTPGTRTNPVYTFPIETNLFGEAYITVPDFTAGTYDITIDKPHMLRRAVNNVKLNFHRVDINFATLASEELRFGDIDDDGRINLNDILAIPNQFQQDPDLVDLNEDGSFDLSDIFNLLQNWGSGE
ncbi:DUF4215 domain-containing protein [Candidatus Peregrinibacteria bacterium]|nr:MAG: DUF4215 domain-containing protein [Candidatus Peregrinibacteria bacterium]